MFFIGRVEKNVYETKKTGIFYNPPTSQSGRLDTFFINENRRTIVLPSRTHGFLQPFSSLRFRGSSTHTRPPTYGSCSPAQKCIIHIGPFFPGPKKHFFPHGLGGGCEKNKLIPPGGGICMCRRIAHAQHTATHPNEHTPLFFASYLLPFSFSLFPLFCSPRNLGKECALLTAFT